MITCIYKHRDNNNNITAYRLIDDYGNVRDVDSEALKQVMIVNKLVVDNLTLTSDNRLVDKSNETKTISKKDKIEKFKMFNSKQKLTDMIFDFEFNEETGKIFITKYYDSPYRKVITIPSFVDGFDSTSGVFSGCANVEKVIMHSNIKGSLYKLFFDFKGYKIDLTEFDTSNINNMSYMFGDTSAKEILFGRYFNTSKVINMHSMFMRSKVKELDLKTFDTSNVKDMSYMFHACNAEELNLGNNFSTCRVTNMDFMFDGIKAKLINLGDKFDTSRVENIGYMFFDVKLDSLYLGDKFNTKNVTYMAYMFANSEIGKLDLGNNFNTERAQSISSLFFNTRIDRIDLKDKFKLKQYAWTEDMFKGCTAKLITIDKSTDKRTLQELKELTDTQIKYM